MTYLQVGKVVWPGWRFTWVSPLIMVTAVSDTLSRT